MMNEPQWHAMSPGAAPKNLQGWLFDKGSFIERLKSYSIKHPEIIVLKNVWEKPLLSEKDKLPIGSNDSALVREVLIKSTEGAWMFARTVFPKETLTGPEERFINLQDQSLGSILFQYPDLQRSDFEIACLPKGSIWYKRVFDIAPTTEEQLWTRRSLFTINEKFILLSEVFLPDVFLLG